MKKNKIHLGKTKPRTNPNNANQYQLDPRQKICWDSFVDPKSETFSNAFKSAFAAGYTKQTALQITTEKWFIEKVRRMNLLGKAEKVLDSMLEIDHRVPKIGMLGPIKDKKTKKQVMETDAQILKVKQDTAKFVAERLGKNEGYSTRTEIGGPDGKDLFRPSPEDEKKAKLALGLK